VVREEVIRRGGGKLLGVGGGFRLRGCWSRARLADPELGPRGDFNHLPCVAQTYLAFACILVLDTLLRI
jgi:hypothetical protein